MQGNEADDSAAIGIFALCGRWQQGNKLNHRTPYAALKRPPPFPRPRMGVRYGGPSNLWFPPEGSPRSQCNDLITAERGLIPTRRSHISLGQS
jgi:hypothetical protein